MLTYKYIPHVITGIFTLMALALYVYNIRSSVKARNKAVRFDKQLQYSLNPEVEREEKDSWLSKKLTELPSLLIKSELVEPSTTVENLQSKIMIAFGIIFAGTSLLAGNVLAGFAPLFIIYGGLQIFASLKIRAHKILIEEQIPGFVSTFKANIQASQHPQNAMINAIDNTASPLFDELEHPKAIMEAGEFKPGIVALRKKTENDTLRQIASCIELASTSGSNIEAQIETIEGIIEDKQIIERKRRLGVNENKPLFIIAALFVPLAFIGSYFFSDMHKDFWFNSTLSWLILMGVVIVMAISIYATWKVIQKVEQG